VAARNKAGVIAGFFIGGLRTDSQRPGLFV